MKGTTYTTKAAILRRGKELIGIPLKNIDKTGRLSTGKGAIGTVIEESWFGYSPNSTAEPDFPEAGVELKVTPYTKDKKGYYAKERLVCNLIDYMEEYKRTFDTSSFWHKCNTMLLLSYEHLYNVSKGEYTISAAVLFSFPQEDLIIIKNDWAIIINKIKSGKAHEISEGDTLYLGACTKGASAGSVRQQPFSSIMAKQRAYSLKQSYMTQVLNSYIFGTKTSEKIIKDWHALLGTTFERYIEDQLSPYYGMTIQELKKHFNIHSTTKNIVELLISRILGVKGHVNQTEEFEKANIELKTIRLEANGVPKESMSFPNFDFIGLASTPWEDSSIYTTLSTKKFMFIIFKREITADPSEMVVAFSIAVKKDHSYTPQQGLTGYRFKKVIFWNMPYDDLEEFHKVYERTVDTIKRGVRLTVTANGVTNDLPKSTESPVAHVRPHGRDSSDTLPLPDGRMMTKQCFWLNRTYIAKICGEAGK